MPGTGVFLLVFQRFLEELFHRTPPDKLLDCEGIFRPESRVFTFYITIRILNKHFRKYRLENNVLTEKIFYTSCPL